MICDRMSEILGLVCHPLSNDGSVAIIDSPFKYPDGDDAPIFIEKLGPQIRFFDDGGALLHLMGRGITLDDHRKTRFIKYIAELNQVKLNELGELEIWSAEDAAPAAFANYMSAMLSLVRWESEQIGISTDISLFLEEVDTARRAQRDLS